MQVADIPARTALPRWFGWIAVLVAFVLLWKHGEALLPWAFDYPKQAIIPAARWITGFTKWLLNEATFGLFTFAEFTRFIAAVIDFPYRVALSLLSTGFLQGEGSSAVQITPPLSWIAVIGTFTLIGLYAGGMRLAALVAACLGFVAVFGQWQSAMVTLASILVAVPLGVIGGLALGILAWRSPAFERAIRPVLDLMQTIPVFAYLVPILFLFGFGPTAAVVATLIYAMPPMTRVTYLALSRVPGDLKDLGRMVGCSRRQMLWRVMVPASVPTLMVGVNQVIMLSLNMVIIASMIGAGGLGFDVLAALRRLDFGAGLEAGLAIVALAVALDRLSQAFAVRRTGAAVQQGNVVQRHPYLFGAFATIVIAGAAGFVAPAVQTYPKELELSTGTFWSQVVAWINVNYFDTIEAVKNAVLLNLLIPFKRFLLDLPWIGVMALIAFAGWRLGGWRLAGLAAALAFLIAATGQWEKAMVTVYLCGISVMFAMLIGVPIGILAAERDRLWAVVRVVIDTLQTLPSFVYLMPAVMLFRVGDFTAMIAVVAYAVAPAVRYTVLGLKGVDPRLIEAGRAMGCTPTQILTRIKLKLALPEIMLGLNQTVMFALSMLVITALVGTRDLGQEVYIALTKADPGRGLVAGLAVAFIAIITDRLIHAGARAARARLGLGEAAS
ncbi:Glycine betaine/proline betaine transport system permease protein ProW [Defluviimonas aquaemixtae]|uniref:Glycine betaine/proline betaine transport system permease protein ProW n=1 Tax=Albidovulum aquaemixtae TaxID=1542388 RepID=A0A2R8B761_9RHOB|nr:ABC transporter permease subunit [Defluviimonas aquaemixtae]SPH18461.1 Glycine betaine/proline betaine transport system permease protein ProW [Defluviimonas aquaemixtae]